MISFASFIETYAYLAVFVGSIFEGETIVILGGLASHSEYTMFLLVVILAFIGAIIGDWSFFFLGRYKKDFVHKHLPFIKKIVHSPTKLMEKKPRTISFSMRFMYGFRHVVPFSFGGTNVRTSTFLLWNALGAIIWAFTFTCLGYFAGNVLENFIGNIKKYEFRIITLTILLVVVVNFVIRNLRVWLVEKNK